MRKALAIDLDGTLLSTNTFRDYLNYCGTAALHSFKFGIAFRIVWWVMLRKIRLISHSRMKEVLLGYTAVFMQRKGRLDNFVEQELLYVNRSAQRLMEQYRNRGYLLILVSASPDLYVRPISEDLNIDLCCATPLPTEVVIGQWKEYVGQQKLEALQRLLQVHKAELEAVITDHHDDIPLLNYNASGRNCIINPSEETIAALQRGCKSVWEKVS